MPAIQNFTADRMSLVTPPNSNGWTIPLNMINMMKPPFSWKLKKLRHLLSASTVLGPDNFSGNIFSTLRFDSKSRSNSALSIPILNCYEKKNCTSYLHILQTLKLSAHKWSKIRRKNKTIFFYVHLNKPCFHFRVWTIKLRSKKLLHPIVYTSSCSSSYIELNKENI